MELADASNAAIVSADSRQVYCYFDIGTAKPTREECDRVTHYGVDVAEPTGRYSAARWASDAEDWIECAGEIDKDHVIVGGTGLYIKALVEPLFEAPEVSPARRAQLDGELEKKTLDELRRWCTVLDAPRAHLGRAQLVRAIETALLSGARISDLHAKQRTDSPRNARSVKAVYLLVDPGPALAGRIEARVDKMFAIGWADEVRELMRSTPPDAPAWKASGYRVMRSYIEGALDLSSARERVIIETRQYAKRQRTWFRHQLPAADVTQINPDDLRAETIAREWWEKAE
jgi:tRNA dimethylallyltransferase